MKNPIALVCLFLGLAHSDAIQVPEDLQPGRGTGVRVLRVLDSGEIVVRRTQDFGENAIVRVRLYGINIPVGPRERRRALRWLRKEFVGQDAGLAVNDRRTAFVVGDVIRYRSGLSMVAGLLRNGLADTWMPDRAPFSYLRREAQAAKRGIWARRR